jgi:hypothetical protein
MADGGWQMAEEKAANAASAICQRQSRDLRSAI